MMPSRHEVRRDLIIVGLATSFLFLVALGARDLWNPNEPIYGLAVAEMHARGDWFVPTVNGLVFAEKPILYYWLALIASGFAGGVSELTLRLPSALAGAVGAVIAYLLVYPYAGRARARLTSAVYATTFMVFWGARTVQMDILVAVTTLAAIAAGVRVLDGTASPWLGWTRVGLATGLGVLAKGPVGIVCPALPLLGYAVLCRRMRRLAHPALLAGAGVCVAVVAPWVIVLLARGQGAVLVEAFYRQNVTRFLDPWDHQASSWYFLWYFWIDMAPWAWFVPLALALPDRDDDERRLDRLAWIWIVGVVLFFSLSPSKRSAYILPVAPAVAVLVSGLAERFVDGRLSRARTLGCLVVLGTCGAAALGFGLYVWLYAVDDYPDLARPGLALAMLLAAGGLSILAGLLTRRRIRTLPTTALFSLVLVLYLHASIWLLPAVNAYKSPRRFCQRVASVVAGEQPVASFDLWDWRSGYAFYLERPIRNLKSVEELRAYWSRREQVFLIVEGSGLDRAREVVGRARPWARGEVGSKIVYLISNRGPDGGAS